MAVTAERIARREAERLLAEAGIRSAAAPAWGEPIPLERNERVTLAALRLLVRSGQLRPRR